MARLSQGGDFTHDSTEAAEARVIFLVTLQRIAPQILETLRDEVLPFYKQGKQNYPNRFTFDLLQKDKRYCELYNGIVTWSKKFNLNYPWVHEVAFKTLKKGVRLESGSNWMRRPTFALPSGDEWVNTEPKFEIYKDMLLFHSRKRIHELVDAFLDRCEEEFRQEDYHQTKSKSKLVGHLIYLGYYLVNYDQYFGQY